jgi:tetratricopeptide (TPR) repeat protein
MGRERINILTTLNTLFLEMEDELPSDTFTDAMRAEVFRLTEDDELSQAEVPGITILYTLNRLFIDDADLEMSVAFTYAMLAEMSRLVKLCANGEDDGAESKMVAWIFIADAYYALCHYAYAMEYYEKAVELLREYHEFMIAQLMDYKWQEEAEEQLEECLEHLLIIYKGMNKEAQATGLIQLFEHIGFGFVKEVVKKADKRPHLKHDPVEYTEKYLAILPELETKIEAALKDVRRAMGFCFRYWHTKKEILKHDYDIEWDSPAVLNPHVRFD